FDITWFDNSVSYANKQFFRIWNIFKSRDQIIVLPNEIQFYPNSVERSEPLNPKYGWYRTDIYVIELLVQQGYSADILKKYAEYGCEQDLYYSVGTIYSSLNDWKVVERLIKIGILSLSFMISRSIAFGHTQLFKLLYPLQDKVVKDKDYIIDAIWRQHIEILDFIGYDLNSSTHWFRNGDFTQKWCELSFLKDTYKSIQQHPDADTIATKILLNQIEYRRIENIKFMLSVFKFESFEKVLPAVLKRHDKTIIELFIQQRDIAFKSLPTNWETILESALCRYPSKNNVKLAECLIRYNLVSCPIKNHQIIDTVDPYIQHIAEERSLEYLVHNQHKFKTNPTNTQYIIDQILKRRPPVSTLLQLYVHQHFIELVFNNVFLSQKIFAFVYKIQSYSRSLRYDDIIEIDWMVSYDHLALLKEKIDRGSTLYLGYNGNELINKDFELFKRVFEEYKYFRNRHPNNRELYNIFLTNNFEAIKWFCENGYASELNLRMVKFSKDSDPRILRYLIENRWATVDYNTTFVEVSHSVFTPEILEVLKQHTPSPITSEQAKEAINCLLGNPIPLVFEYLSPLFQENIDPFEVSRACNSSHLSNYPIVEYLIENKLCKDESFIKPIYDKLK
ncbi:hypothetical protein CYY_010555, partial [Polysphondylium violaceum]